MAAVLRSTEIGVRQFGTSVTVPDNPKAKLMYYLNCMCVVLDLNDEDGIDRLTDYSNYYGLSEAEIDVLVGLCFLLSPDVLAGKVIFQDDAMCGNSSNEFFELSAVRNNLVVTESILIGGQERQVHKIMAFKRTWLHTYWLQPMQALAGRLERLASGGSGAQHQRAITYDSYDNGDRCCCTIL